MKQLEKKKLFNRILSSEFEKEIEKNPDIKANIHHASQECASVSDYLSDVRLSEFLSGLLNKQSKSLERIIKDLESLTGNEEEDKMTVSLIVETMFNTFNEIKETLQKTDIEIEERQETINFYLE